MNTIKASLIFSLLVISTSLSASIRTEKTSKNLIVDFYATRNTEIDFEYIEKDIRQAFSKAIQQKCNSILFRNNKGSFFKIIKGKDEVTKVEYYINEIKNEIDAMSIIDYKEGKLLRTEKTRISGPKYRSETYINGRLDSTYETDWTLGYFTTETSTYKSGNYTYVTKTFYVPEKYDIKEIRETGTKTIIQSGISSFVTETYHIEQ